MKILKHWRAKVEVEISKSNPNTSIDKEGFTKYSRRQQSVSR
jgi:hypothetical protein